ncbi:MULTISPECIES: lysophospholipid acyltransferase family protein [Clostridium]|uniref:1-acyl-sn-glycerol-3-phosphate acyltransferase n=1 Tax=Clostridium senegalense TaxID=1465809 RepID=A0A6M0H811_9CLOT|nr:MULTISPECIES: lysophospholipid acyltransferase family protein [Clostridium]NEU06001.1 1-acyl-sn-glycerol-3-phosphate acyltransferase [Clostridium senegalense]
MRKFWFLLQTVIYTAFSAIFIPKAEKLKKKSKKEYEDYTNVKGKEWSKFLLKATGLNIIVKGKENEIEGPCLYVSNHQSIVDIPLIFSVVEKPLGAVAKKELEKIPVLSYWCKAIGCVFLDRENPREGIKAIQRGTENLKNGQSMLIFPEGTRSKNGQIGEFKKGSLRMAIKSGMPIIPVTVKGTYKIYEGYKDAKKENKDCICIIHEPIYTKDLSKDELNGLVEKCQDIIDNTLKKL